ncbi:hypothetical protein N0V84_001211 [Fusarium piperis]|uniref:Uncharacterized protein n=1 Tax=Fusarium piperis TaxID=1435070 RepID=A0A9W9BUI1_9HYPO|nr:hypothetical protein N0V84_001211 [Fusarium piperis]
MPDVEFFGPLIILGEGTHDHVCTGYAVQPNSTFLWPHSTIDNERRCHYPGLMHESLLAINFDVPTNSRGQLMKETRNVKQELVTNRAGGTGPDSVSDRGEGTGHMVFVQVGELFVYHGGWSTARTKNPDEIISGSWVETGFGVVALVDSHGQAQSLFAIYNCMEPVEAGDAQDVRVHQKPDEVLDGFIFKKSTDDQAHVENRFHAFKLSDDLHGFGTAKHLDIRPVCKLETQIVLTQRWEYETGRKVVVPLCLQAKKDAN